MTKLQQSIMILLSTGAIIIIFGILYYYDSIKETDYAFDDVEEIDNYISDEESKKEPEEETSTFKSAFAPPPTEEKLYEPIISMTDYEVMDSTWGKPLKINRTETAFSVREQWVYPNNKYLYFEDGYLVSISSSR